MIVDAPWYMASAIIRRDLLTPTVEEEICHYSFQYSGSPKCTSKRPSSEPNGATREKAIVKTPAI
jgi:hypothetical protein